MNSAPREGETVLFCKHCDVEDGDHIVLPHPTHWFMFTELTEIVRKADGSHCDVQFMVLCEGCFLSRGGGPASRNHKGGSALHFAAKDARWIGEPPVITRFA